MPCYNAMYDENKNKNKNLTGNKKICCYRGTSGRLSWPINIVPHDNIVISPKPTADLNVYAEHVTGYIIRLVEECIPTKTVLSFPNRKPWMDPNIRIKRRE